MWDKKKSKIRLDKLKGSYEEGGLQLIDLKLKNLSIKITWICRILEENSFLSEYVYSRLPIKNEQFWKCNVKP